MALLVCSFFFFFFNDPATPEIYPLPLHAPLPFWRGAATHALLPPVRDEVLHLIGSHATVELQELARHGVLERQVRGGRGALPPLTAAPRGGPPERHGDGACGGGRAHPQPAPRQPWPLDLCGG